MILSLRGDRHLRSPQNQNLSKMREVLKYGIFDISSMSTKGFWLTYVKTSFFVYFWDKNAIFLQISFVPYLTSACPAAPSSRTAGWWAQSPMCWSTIRHEDTASSLKICWKRHRNTRARESLALVGVCQKSPNFES